MTDHLAWSFRGGDWFGVFGQRTTVVLPPSERSRAAAIWELVDAGAGFDEILDALISSGLRELPGFVLVEPVGRPDPGAAARCGARPLRHRRTTSSTSTATTPPPGSSAP